MRRACGRVRGRNRRERAVDIHPANLLDKPGEQQYAGFATPRLDLGLGQSDGSPNNGDNNDEIRA